MIVPWVPPATTASQRPEATRSAASPTAWVPPAQAVTSTFDGPRQPRRRLMVAATAFSQVATVSAGATARGPSDVRTCAASSSDASAPYTVENTTPARRAGTDPGARPPSRRARSAAAAPYRVKGSERRTIAQPRPEP